MIIIKDTTDFQLNGNSAVAIGKFDGVHLGHHKLINRILEQKQNGLLAVIFTFDKTPAVFFGKKDQKELTTIEEKRRIFESMGIDVLIEFPLNEQTAATDAMDFVTDILVGKMKTKYIAAGTDLSFGDKGRGNAILLQNMSRDLDYQVEIIDKVMLENVEISSTLVREYVERGDMKGAKACLGMDYSVSGIVQPGKKLGRTLGMPTVNLLPQSNKLLPPNGVYYSRVLLDEKWLPSITNIGYKPSATNDHIMGAESYIYDFDRDIYGKDITVALIEFKRPEMKFDSIDALKCQMETDINAGRSYHGLE